LIKGMKTKLHQLMGTWDERYKLEASGNKVNILAKDGRLIESVDIPAKGLTDYRRKWNVYPEEKPKRWQKAYFEVIDNQGRTKQAYWNGRDFDGALFEGKIVFWREYE
jgi:hypothetical protein